MKTISRKLVLNKETIRELTSHELEKVAGGATSHCTLRSACGGCSPTCPCKDTAYCSGG